MKDLLDIREDVRRALEEGRPVLALESTIISHGMPYPRNLETAFRAEELARERGVTPATVGIADGRIRIGLTEELIQRFAAANHATNPPAKASTAVQKVSRSDISCALAGGGLGATTVSGTMAAAHMAGIAVMATGGIGGVHRGFDLTMDVSADLLELARTPVLVVSAGAKAILDLPRTLEYLETQGVPVLGYQTDEFPAFYSRSSGCLLDLRVDTPIQAARIYRIQRELEIRQGILVANPVPASDEIPSVQIRRYLRIADRELKSRRIQGKELTPFLLSRLGELSKGATLSTNVKLLENNVRLASEIAVCVSDVSA